METARFQPAVETTTENNDLLAEEPARRASSFTSAGEIPGVEGDPHLQRISTQPTPLASDQPQLSSRQGISPSDHAYGPHTGAAAGSLNLTHAQRDELVRLAGNNMLRAYTAFTGACSDMKLELFAAAQESSEMISLLASTLFGMALPGIGALVGNAVPGALAGLSNLFPQAMRHTVAELAPEMIKELAHGAGEIGIATVVDHVGPFRQSETAGDFVDELNRGFQGGTQALDQALPAMSDLALLGMYFKYDYHVMNVTRFKESLRSRCAVFASLQQMGHMAGAPGDSASSYQELMYVGDPARGTANPLYMCSRTEYGFGQRDFTVDRSSLVPDDMREMALEMYARHSSNGRIPRTISGDGADAVATPHGTPAPHHAPAPQHPSQPQQPAPNIYGGVTHRG